jgi:O-acetyl-ADP-ribose deacetylase (regulator of RNase III)
MLNYKRGNVARQQFTHDTIIPHVVNNENRMGSGLARAIYERWPIVKELYHIWGDQHTYGGQPFQLGKVQFISVDVRPNVIVANMIGQTECGGRTIYDRKLAPIRLDCLKECMLWVAHFCSKRDIHIATGKFGSKRAGGDWDRDIVPLIEDIWRDFNVTIFEFEE